MLRKPEFKLSQVDSTHLGQLNHKLKGTIWVPSYKVELVATMEKLHEEALYYCEEALNNKRSFSYRDEMTRLMEEKEIWI
jgi:hypothetical protein